MLSWICANILVVVKNPLSRELLPYSIRVLMLSNYIAVEHPGGEGVACELFELGLESFVVRTLKPIELTTGADCVSLLQRTLDH